MRRVRVALAVAGLALLGIAPPAPAPPAPVVSVRPAPPSDRPHRVYHAGPGRSVRPGAEPAWRVPVWVDVDLPFLRRPVERRARPHPGVR